MYILFIAFKPRPELVPERELEHAFSASHLLKVLSIAQLMRFATDRLMQLSIAVTAAPPLADCVTIHSPTVAAAVGVTRAKVVKEMEMGDPVTSLGCFDGPS